MSVRPILLAALVLLAPITARAAEPASLYQARTIVTGQREPERLVGFGSCIEDVLIKASGDPRLADDPRLAPMRTEAGHFVTAYRYHDRMSGIPLHDEQGTRDRPYDLFATFSQPGIDALLASLGEKPWRGPRPKLAVFLGIHQGKFTYVLARDGEHGIDQREALESTADRRGMTAVLPDASFVAAHRLTFQGLAAAGPLKGDEMARAVGGDVPLSGALVWDTKTSGWVADWRLNWHRRIWRWRIRKVSFDQAFRSGIGGAEQILSGHGGPH